ncbi:MAG: zinc-dependent peptidase [Cyclobacteriaceae bacterium]|nr:zinc-dependent peptidase [Cyclobacteriaceae bacterium]
MALFIVAVVFVITAAIYRHQLEAAYEEAGRRAAPVRSAVLPFPQHYREILLKYFPYYQRLSREHQNKFEHKLMHFILSKKFIPRQFDAVTDEMKLMIGACAVQLTFGLPQVYLRHFNKILIYPTDYYSSISKRFHKGEVNPAFGAIVLSWKSFVDGYIYPTDSVNLGLHEMAHALRLENIIHNDEYDFFDDDLVEKFDSYAYQLCHLPTNDGNPFLRPYACANEHEFFAVSVENFFERPAEFKMALPGLYEILSKLLRQDPLILNP